MADLNIQELLPRFVRTHRNLDAFWPFIKNEAPSYAERREIISKAFTPLMDHLEGRNSAPADKASSDVLGVFDADGVHVVWAKVLERRSSDPEGAITGAEAICPLGHHHGMQALPSTRRAQLPRSLLRRFGALKGQMIIVACV